MVAIGEGEARLIYRVVKFGDGNLVLAPHNEAGNLKSRDKDPADPLRYLNMSATRIRADGLRKVHVTAIGGIRDPGDRR
ncbi:MAG: hypothetical protein ACK5WM_02360 [Rhodospirillales bacterium]